MQDWKMQQRRTIRIIGTIAAVLSLILASGRLEPHTIAAGQGPYSTNVVAIDNFTFTPTELPIPAGTQVTWINKDDVPHTVVSVDHKFKSRALDTDEKFSFVFQTPGKYQYFCSVHPMMIGMIIVK
jgi:plastocyanin